MEEPKSTFIWKCGEEDVGSFRKCGAGQEWVVGKSQASWTRVKRKLAILSFQMGEEGGKMEGGESLGKVVPGAEDTEGQVGLAETRSSLFLFFPKGST